MKYITVSEASIKLKISERSIRKYCVEGRVPGAKQSGRNWLVPASIKRPMKNKEKTEQAYEELGNELISFIDESPVSFFAIENVKMSFLSNGYVELYENKPYTIQRGMKAFFIRNGTSLVALNVGKDVVTPQVPFHVIASHADSPCFKIKPLGEGSSEIYRKLNVEPYGGMIASTWLDKPLGIAGRAVIKENDALKSKLVKLERTVVIPNLCIHFNREVNKGYQFDMAVDMQPLVSQEIDGVILKEDIATELNLKKEEIVSHDLFLYCKEEGMLWSDFNQYVSAPRLDDLECVFASSKAFGESDNPKAVNVLYIADNEEVGSSSRQGADSDFLKNILKRAIKDIGGDYPSSMADSFLISADNAHAVHPNKGNFSDEGNRPFLNKGIAIKSNASQSYTSDAISMAIFEEICRMSKTPYQFFSNRSDLRGGSTLGNILLNHVSFLSVDVGLPQLAMHSSYETAGAKDVKHAVDAFKAFYRSSIDIDGDSFYVHLP